MTTCEQRPEWIDGLLEAHAYDHDTGPIELVETHISWLILTGVFAYKIKKPVSLGFVDFSTLEKREHFCHEEIRLNRRYAPDLYLGVVPITGNRRRPRVDDDGPVLDHAVKMHQFDGDQLLSRLAEQGRLTGARVDELARAIAEFHQQAGTDRKISPDQGPDRAFEPVIETVDELGRLAGSDRIERLGTIQRWLAEFREQHAGRHARRAEGGYWRECHGDLHLENIVVWRDRVTLFDGIEFNPKLHWIDVMSDLAFTIMDFERKGCPEFAFRLLNGYLQRTGDYAGLGVLDFYLVYRVLVRAKVRAIRFEQQHRARGIREAISPHLEQAAKICAGRKRALLITHGLSGSGKSFWAERLCRRLGLIHLRSDCERRRFAQPDSQRYTDTARGRVYDRMLDQAYAIIDAGYPVLVDATFLDAGQRRRFRETADRLEVPFRVLRFHADPEVLEKRVMRRQIEGTDPSEAGVEVLRAQLADYQPPEVDEAQWADEAQWLVSFDTGADLEVETVVGTVARESGLKPPDS